MAEATQVARADGSDGSAHGLHGEHTFGVPWSHQNLTHPVVQAYHDDRTLGERVADTIARFGGSWPFIFTFVGLIFGWMILNTLFIDHLLHGQPFDRYPYIALNLVLSGLAGLQAPIIMMSQNRSAARDEALAAHHYEPAQKVETLTESIEHLLEVNTDLTQKIHDLTSKVHEFVARPRTSGGPGPTA